LRLQFNVAHSGGIALYAFSGGKSVGIDIESIRTDFACEEIAARYFAPAERKRLTQCPTSLKQRSFFACWTRKEAAIKAVGAGLSIPLDSFEVPVLPEAFPQPLVLKWLSETPPHWWLESLNVAPDFAAAVVVEGDSPQFRYWTFPAAYLDPLT
jgi:4'-phosphopantetheinyl transferase